MSWAFDATPLIYLAKAEGLGVVEALDEPRVIPEAVYHEVVTAGVEQGYDDARRIERAVENGLIDVVAVDTDGSAVATRLARHPGLSDADVTVLACADARDAVAVMDESASRSAAEVEDIETRGTAYLVLAAVRDGALSTAAGRDTVDAMVDRGWYVAPDVYTRIVEKLESLAE
ncbi:hypothetical protein C464_02605 [Halorubrum coriense DSM 10284]|uniref:DUF3368 domain-containing protein n=1 Tax=Halorubrum coriense DSM 10284 TaxID=1227466 RepID=M0ERY3_9EURY|nr:DUF3368 domain-containing protein [Halorubrum coriense]ELZ50455.1 hypothetical protein C464_02605 [Halorubrum coriense DSM 10284]